MKDPKMIEKKDKLIDLVQGFCLKQLDEEYEQVCIKLIEKLSRKRSVPFLSGKLEVWAAGTIHAVGTINFLFDKSSEPYATVHDICGYFGTAQSTTSQKSKAIRDLLKLGYFDTEFQIASVRKENPFNNMMMINGFIVSKDMME